jgi:predicted transcriptional regulator
VPTYTIEEEPGEPEEKERCPSCGRYRSGFDADSLDKRATRRPRLKMVKISLKLPPDVLEAVDRWASLMGMSRSEYIRMALRKTYGPHEKKRRAAQKAWAREKDRRG